MTGRPNYLDIPYESPARIGANGVPLPPLADGSAAVPPPLEPPIPAPRNFAENPSNASPRPAFKMVEEERPVSPETTEALLQAIHKVFRVATARIKYHEAEAARLRAALAPFAGLSRQSPESPAALPSTETALTSLIEAVRLLPELERVDEAQPQS